MGEREGGGQGKGGEGGLKDGTGISSFYIVSSFQFRCLIVIIKLATCSGEPPLPTQPPLPPPHPSSSKSIPVLMDPLRIFFFLVLQSHRIVNDPAGSLVDS